MNNDQNTQPDEELDQVAERTADAEQTNTNDDDQDIDIDTVNSDEIPDGDDVDLERAE